MSAEYQIVAVTSGPREWKGGGNSTFHAYRCTLRNAAGREMDGVEVNKKPPNAPSVNDTVYGDVAVDVPHGPKFTTAQRPGGPGGGAPSSDGGGGANDNSVSIEAQVAFKGAVKLITAGLASTDDLLPQTLEGYAAIQAAKKGVTRGAASPFTKDAPASPPTTEDPPFSDVPVDTSDFEGDGQTAPPDSDEIPF